LPEYREISFLAKSVFGDALKSRLPRIAFLAFSYSYIPWNERWYL